MRQNSRLPWPRLAPALAAVMGLLLATPAAADVALLWDWGVLVDNDPDSEPQGGGEGENPIVEPKNASYESTGGWAVTGTEFIDAMVWSFWFDDHTTVAAATLRVPIETVWAQNGSALMNVFSFSDQGDVNFRDYAIGFPSPVAQVEVNGQTLLEVDVTGAVNSALQSGPWVGFRISSATEPGSVDPRVSPAYTGAKFFSTSASVEFIPGPAPLPENDAARFDGYTLQIPNIEVSSVGTVEAIFNLVDPNSLTYALTYAAVVGGAAGPPPLSGAQLFDCASFAPPFVAGVAEGVSTYSITSGILDAPSVNLNDEQIAVRLEYIEGTENPWLFETLSFGAVQAGPTEALVSDLGGGLVVEPTQDFVSLCHGWVLIGDFIRNRVVERNLISGETAGTYDFNTKPDQFTLDEVNNIVYMTVHPESERIYHLNLNTGIIGWDPIMLNMLGNSTTYEYRWALRDIALGENGNLFAVMYDGERFDPGDGIFFSDTGLWLGNFTGNGTFLSQPIPLENPIRVEYDPVRDHLFLTTESNLATFDFFPGTNQLIFILGTDISVGGGCTDFDISPDGNRLAYSCPGGNNIGIGAGTENAVVDMDPRSYHDNDGAWILNGSPVSATFNADGSLLLATDNDLLYFFDAARHLILEDFDLGLLDGEEIRKIRISRDGELIYLFVDNEKDAPSSKIYYMPMPDISAFPP